MKERTYQVLSSTGGGVAVGVAVGIYQVFTVVVIGSVVMMPRPALASFVDLGCNNDS